MERDSGTSSRRVLTAPSLRLIAADAQATIAVSIGEPPTRARRQSAVSEMIGAHAERNEFAARDVRDTRNGVGEVVVTIGRMVDGVATAARRPAFEADDLLNQPGLIDQLHHLIRQQRQETDVEIVSSIWPRPRR